MTNKETIQLALRVAEDKIDSTLPPCIPREEACLLTGMRHGILATTSSMIAALYAHELNDGVESTILWDAGVAQVFETWAIDRMTMPDVAIHTEALFDMLEAEMTAYDTAKWS